MIVRFTVPGKPVPKGRPRFARGRTITPQRTRDYEAHVKITIMHALSLASGWRREGARRVRLIFEFTDACRGDIDNLAKAVLDACNGLLWHDDRQVVDLHVQLVSGFVPRTIIEVEDLGADVAAIGGA